MEAFPSPITQLKMPDKTWHECIQILNEGLPESHRVRPRRQSRSINLKLQVSNYRNVHLLLRSTEGTFQLARFRHSSRRPVVGVVGCWYSVTVTPAVDLEISFSALLHGEGRVYRETPFASVVQRGESFGYVELTQGAESLQYKPIVARVVKLQSSSGVWQACCITATGAAVTAGSRRLLPTLLRGEHYCHEAAVQVLLQKTWDEERSDWAYMLHSVRKQRKSQLVSTPIHEQACVSRRVLTHDIQRYISSSTSFFAQGYTATSDSEPAGYWVVLRQSSAAIATSHLQPDDSTIWDIGFLPAKLAKEYFRIVGMHGRALVFAKPQAERYRFIDASNEIAARDGGVAMVRARMWRIVSTNPYEGSSASSTKYSSSPSSTGGMSDPSDELRGRSAPSPSERKPRQDKGKAKEAASLTASDDVWLNPEVMNDRPNLRVHTDFTPRQTGFRPQVGTVHEGRTLSPDSFIWGDRHGHRGHPPFQRSQYRGGRKPDEWDVRQPQSHFNRPQDDRYSGPFPWDMPDQTSQFVRSLLHVSRAGRHAEVQRDRRYLRVGHSMAEGSQDSDNDRHLRTLFPANPRNGHGHIHGCGHHTLCTQAIIMECRHTLANRITRGDDRSRSRICALRSPDGRSYISTLSVCLLCMSLSLLASFCLGSVRAPIVVYVFTKSLAQRKVIFKHVLQTGGPAGCTDFKMSLCSTTPMIQDVIRCIPDHSSTGHNLSAPGYSHHRREFPSGIPPGFPISPALRNKNHKSTANVKWRNATPRMSILAALLCAAESIG